MTEILNPDMEADTEAAMAADMARALALASDASPDSLEQLKTLPVHIRGSKAVLDNLGCVTGVNSEYAMQYIVDQAWDEAASIVDAVYALSLFNTHKAEDRIVNIAEVALDNILGLTEIALDSEEHREHIAIRSAVIGALEQMKTETAAARILQLGSKYDVLTAYAMTSLEKLYRENQETFGSAYRSMLKYATGSEIMYRLVSDADDVTSLSLAFQRADEHKILGTIPDDLTGTPGRALLLPQTPNLCSEMFRLALEERELHVEAQIRREARDVLSRARNLG